MTSPVPPAPPAAPAGPAADNRRVALVTGASRGIGRMLVEHLLGAGYLVVGMSRKPSSHIHPNYAHLAADVADHAAVQKAFLGLHASHGRLDLLVYNASVLTSQYAMVLPPERAREMVETNLLGAFFVAREAARLMKTRKFGRMVLVSSMAASLEPPGDSVYAATKAGAATLMNVLAKELAPHGITCNTLAVSAYPTDMLAQLPAEKVRQVVAGLPIPRMATAEDITHAVDFFASERSGYLTAQTLWLGGVH